MPSDEAVTDVVAGISHNRGGTNIRVTETMKMMFNASILTSLRRTAQMTEC